MSECYLELLDATIRYLEGLRAQGRMWIPVQPHTWDALASCTSVPRDGMPKKTAARIIGTPDPALYVPQRPSLQSAPVSVAPPKKLAALSELRNRVIACDKCPHLVRSRKNVVFGVGDVDSPLLFVGEAPGAEEDRQAEPFVGAAGQLLTRIITAMGFTRETVYIANVLKCRPDTPDQTAGNRKPTAEEMQVCLPYLLDQIRIIEPRVIVALGATAMEGLFGKIAGISKLRGNWQAFHAIPVMPTYHPSYLLRNQTLSIKRQVWEDMLKVLEKLEVPISEKQRNFFRS